MTTATATHDAVREYYGKVIQKQTDLKTGACCPPEAMPPRIRAILAELHPELLDRFYGCGSPIPPALEGRTVLDLGCGAGRDVYVASKLVGETGRVIGVDMTAEQLVVAQRHVSEQTERFGYAAPNVEFIQGEIEDLATAGVADASVDVVISNCVINLALDKRRVFAEVFRVLKPGGELYFSDVFAGRRVPEALQTDPVLRGECLAGAMYVEDFRRLLAGLGCADYRAIERHRVALHDADIEAKIGHIDFQSLTVRAFKLDTLEDICEDYGQVATYRGTLPECPRAMVLDDHHRFETNKPMLVCGNTASMLAETRFAPYFQVRGDRGVHYGPFDCSPSSAETDENGTGGACC